jgi:hypothetical protein
MLAQMMRRVVITGLTRLTSWPILMPAGHGAVIDKLLLPAQYGFHRLAIFFEKTPKFF